MKLYRGGAQVTCDVLMCSQVFLVTSLKTQHTTAYARCSCVTFTGHRPHGGFELVKETCAAPYTFSFTTRVVSRVKLYFKAPI